jgi:hypothetical protein
MTEAERLREQAERYLRLARSTADREVAEKLIALAAGYLDSAHTLERLAAAQAVPPTTSGQPAQQQQQIQPKPDEDTD